MQFFSPSATIKRFPVKIKINAKTTRSICYLIRHKIFLIVIKYGYVGLFGSLVLGIVGVPLPDEVLMTFAGYLVSKGELSFIPTVAVTLAGSFVGMTISFWIGRKFGYPLVEKYGAKIRLTKEKLEQSERWFRRFGKFAVSIGYFIPGVRHLTAYFAGISKWPYSLFATYALPGAMVWTLTFISLGAYVGEHWRWVGKAIHRYLLLGFPLILIMLAAAYGIKRYRFSKSKVK